MSESLAMAKSGAGLPAVEAGPAEGLPAPQQEALAAIKSGLSFPKAAEAAGVGRTTIYRWVQSDPHFRAAYNAWQQETRESAHARLLKLTEKAVEVVEAALRRSDEKTAVALLKHLGVLRPRRAGTTEANVLQVQMLLEKSKREHKADTALARHLLGKAGLTPREQRRFLRDPSALLPPSEPDEQEQAMNDGEEPDPVLGEANGGTPDGTPGPSSRQSADGADSQPPAAAEVTT
jgi:transposase